VRLRHMPRHGGNGLNPVHQEERRFPRGPTGRCLVGPQCAQKLINLLGTMLLQAVIGACIETPEYFSLGPLDLFITL
jgi:hypothetical protein